MFSVHEKNILKDWYIHLNQKKCCRNQYSGLSERQQWIKENPCPLKDKLQKIYEEGHGFKTLAKELDITYPVLRRLYIEHLALDYRKGYDVITDKLREKRSFNVSGEKSPWYNWPEKTPELLAKNGRSIQGYYRKLSGELVWLRSTYEYIMAKWLDKMKLDWKVEHIVYRLSNGENYRPDFFIYENNKLQSIMEVKSRYFNKGNREYKFHMFKEEFDIECVLITNIKPYTEKTYHQELKEWKEKRLLEK